MITEADLIQQRLDSVVRFDKQWIDSLEKQREQAQDDFHQLLAAVLDGEEIVILGRRCRISIQWLEDPPFRWGDNFQADMAASLRRTT